MATDELFRALQNGTIDAVQSDDATMASPVDINVFGGYFPFSTRYSLDLPVLFKYYGMNEIWAEAYGEIKGVEWLGAGAWDPCHILTKKPIRSLADMKGKRVFGVPHRRQVPLSIRFGAGHLAVGRHRSRASDRRTGRSRLVRIYRSI